ncbi:hypothetical protein MK079_01450, partial [Candidatus Gracilibacteria bacterium]|nr:hypothetical protein [Candidatus Gracilibacteria bacterium]
MSFEIQTIIETKSCLQCGVFFDITDKDLEFYEKVSPTFGGKKYAIPSPTLCPECRQQRRLVWRNERKLYKRKCDATGKDMISMYSPDTSYTVYDQTFWWSDKWDPLAYGKDIDITSSILSQFHNINIAIPQVNLLNQNSQNSPYSNYESDEKDCYLTVGGHWNENCMYGNYYIKSKDSVDNYWLFDSSMCYECINSYDLYKCSYMMNSRQSRNCYLGYDLVDCSDCFGCTGLRNKRFCIFNKQYSQQDYYNEYERLRALNLQEQKALMRKVSMEVCRKNLNLGFSQNCVGDEIFHSQNILHSFQIEDFDTCKYGTIVGMGKNCMDVSNIGRIEMSYESAHGGLEGYKNVFSVLCYGCKNIFYAYNCHNSSDLFLCIGLRNKQYCILNKQYSKEEYEELVPKIIE